MDTEEGKDILSCPVEGKGLLMVSLAVLPVYGVEIASVPLMVKEMLVGVFMLVTVW